MLSTETSTAPLVLLEPQRIVSTAERDYESNDLKNAAWKRFKKVHVSASIDASHELGTEIREGFNWEQFLLNRKEMLEICPEIYFEISPTVSALNINNLPKLHQHLVENNLLNINNIYLNILKVI